MTEEKWRSEMKSGSTDGDRREREMKERTHVYFVGESVVYDFEKANDMRMSALFHDGNLFANLVLRAPKLVDERQVRLAGEVVVSSKLPEAVALVLAPDALDSLHGRREKEDGAW